MYISDILIEKGGEVYSVDSQQSVHDAVAVMTEHSVGSALVMEKDCVVGIMTRQNILNTIAKDGDIVTQYPVMKLMSGGVITCTPEDSVEHALHLMNRHNISHLPILEEGKVCGIVSRGDIMKASVNAYQFENRLLKRYIQTWPDEHRGGGLKLVVNNKFHTSSGNSEAVHNSQPVKNR